MKCHLHFERINFKTITRPTYVSNSFVIYTSSVLTITILFINFSLLIELRFILKVQYVRLAQAIWCLGRSFLIGLIASLAPPTLLYRHACEPGDAAIKVPYYTTKRKRYINTSMKETQHLRSRLQT